MVEITSVYLVGNFIALIWREQVQDIMGQGKTIKRARYEGEKDRVWRGQGKQGHV